MSILATTRPTSSSLLLLTHRALSTSSSTAKKRIVLVGAGFIGSYIAKALIQDPRNQVVIASRNPQKVHASLKHLGTSILPPAVIDITQPSTLPSVFAGADTVVSLVGLLTGTAKQFKQIQAEGGENVARVAKEMGVRKVVAVSALGVENGTTPYATTKMEMEASMTNHHPTATILRPSVVFGPGDSFFTRFADLISVLPLLPIFNAGRTKFQPIYVGDLAKAIEVCTRDDEKTQKDVQGKIILGGGPDILTYKQLMRLTLHYTSLASRRLLLPLPFWVGMIQAFFLEKLPVPASMVLTRDQVRQLQQDNIETPVPVPTSSSSSTLAQSSSTDGGIRNITQLLAKYPPSMVGSSVESTGLKTVYDILPMYIHPKGFKAEPTDSGKRRHGRDYGGGLEGGLDKVQVRKMIEGTSS